jgi:hypothetical protein
MLQMNLSAIFHGPLSVYINLILICISFANTITLWQVYITGFYGPTAPMAPGPTHCRGFKMIFI